jgi:hypothetical protein
MIAATISATLTIATPVAASISVTLAVVASVSFAVSFAIRALVVRHRDGDSRGREVSGGVGALNRYCVNPSASFSRPVRSQVHGEISGDYPVTWLCLFVAADGDDVAGGRIATARGGSRYRDGNHFAIRSRPLRSPQIDFILHI